jgi:hypothetical protein
LCPGPQVGRVAGIGAPASAQPEPTGPRDQALRRLRWAWPVAILLGFPLGGLLANVAVGRIDSFGAAIAGGLIAGAVTGAAQWLALRPLVPWLWVAATSAGMAVGLAAGEELVDYGIGRGDVALMGAVTGLGAAGLQALVLARRVPRAVWWALAGPPVWAVAWVVTSFVISRNVEDGYTNFGASGALLFALLTLGLLTFLFGRARPGVPVS